MKSEIKHPTNYLGNYTLKKTSVAALTKIYYIFRRDPDVVFATDFRWGRPHHLAIFNCGHKNTTHIHEVSVSF